MIDHVSGNVKISDGKDLLQDLVDWISVPAICVDADDKSNFVLNSAARNFCIEDLGHDPASVERGRFWPVNFPFQDLESSLIEGWWDNGGEFNFRCGDGAPRRLSLNAEKVARGDRAAFLFRIRAPNTDVRAAPHLDVILRRLDRAQALSNTGCWEWDILTDDLTWSDEIFRIFGLTPGAFRPSYPAFLEQVHPDDRTLVEQAVQRAVEDGADYDINHRILRPDG
ncbi:MAG: PAS domain-containing protein, partial [Reyranella sp.]|nr:PAS domain-containing protein [Reyranella sp.]